MSGVVESGKRYHCTPRHSLENKSFSASKWEYEHLFLIDATRQFQEPSLFITLTVGEWNFPKCKWMDMRSKKTSENFQRLPYDVTVHVLHVMEQYARGYISGGNDKSWKRHVVADTRHMRSNVKMYFYRFEYQNRGSPHLHMLLWLTNLSNMDTDRFSAHAPVDNPEMHYTVEKLQVSKRDKTEFPIVEKTTCSGEMQFL